MPALTKYNVNDIIQIQLLGQLNGRNTMNTFHFQSKRNNLFVSDIGDDMNYMCFLLKNLAVNTMRWVAWKHRRVRPLPITEYGTVSLFVSNGVGTGAAMPPTVAALYRINTLLDAPAGRGRIYLPGMPLGYWDGLQYTFTARQNLQNTGSAFFDQWKATSGFSGNMFLGVASKLVSPVAFNGCIGFDWQAYPASMRRRGFY